MSSSENESSYSEESCANEALWVSQDLYHKAGSLMPNYQKKRQKETVTDSLSVFLSLKVKSPLAKNRCRFLSMPR